MLPKVYRVQVLAALEAVRRRLDGGGDPRLSLMVPLVGTAEELHLVREMIQEEVHYAGRQLEVTIGTMIELPRAALTAGDIALESDFFSFGTNDLTQTTLGLSRDDAEEAFLRAYLERGLLRDNPFRTIDREGVGRLIRIAIEEGLRTNPNLEIGVCGEHGADPASIEFFHEAGVDYVSCSPPRIPVAKIAAAQAADPEPPGDAGYSRPGRIRRLTPVPLERPVISSITRRSTIADPGSSSGTVHAVTGPMSLRYFSSSKATASASATSSCTSDIVPNTTTDSQSPVSTSTVLTSKHTRGFCRSASTRRPGAERMMIRSAFRTNETGVTYGASSASTAR